MLKLKKVFCLICAVACLLTAFPVGLNISAADSDNIADAVQDIDEIPTYEEYLKDFDSENIANDEIIISGDSVVSELSNGFEIKDYADKENVCIVNGDECSVTYKLSVQQEGLYNLAVDYIQADDSKITDIQFDVKIDGILPSVSMKSVTLTRFWQLSGEKTFDSRGNEQYRESKQYPHWNESYIYDCEGRQNEPLRFFLTEGEHTVTFDFEYSGIAIESISFKNEETPKSYKKSNNKPVDSEPIVIEAEDYLWSSDASIVTNVEKNDPSVSPNDALTMRYNTVGGASFNSTGQEICWEFDAPESGYYKIAVKARQNEKKGFFSARALKIDGKIPYSECENIRFTYSPDWYNQVISDDKGNDILFYLEKGKHQISLQCVPGELSQSMTVLEDCISKLNKSFLQVHMIVGSTADKYRDYFLLEDIPTLQKDIYSVLRTLVKEKKKIQSISGKEGGELSALQSMITQLDTFMRDIDKMAIKLDSFKSNISLLSAWVLDLKTQPLELDYIILYGNDKQLPKANGGAVKKFFYNMKRLVLSFGDDYGVIGDYSNKEDLTVWVSTGQDQLNVIQNSVAQSYSSKNAASIKIQLVQAGLLEAVMAGEGPDVAMFIAGDLPVNLASRGGLTALSDMEGYEDVVSRFMENATLPYMYNGKCYALPLTQSFQMMFVRTDIFEELGISIPDTWDDLFEILPILQRNNLEVGIPSDLSTFATFALQNGGTYYSDDFTATAFDKAPETKAFILWTDLFTKYGLELSYDFSNRFRTGEMPIGIADYSAYALLKASAPEISDRWDIFPIPATNAEDGTLNRSTSGATKGTVGLQQGNTCAVILNKCVDKQLAWDFLNWFTSTEAQADYGLSLEMRMGVSGRYTPANVEALKRLPWTENEHAKLLRQWESLVMINEIPGSYYVTRHLSNAFRQVVYNDENATYTLNKYNELINRELLRKREELKSVG